MITTCPPLSTEFSWTYPRDSDNNLALRFNELSQDRCKDSNTRSSHTVDKRGIDVYNIGEGEGGGDVDRRGVIYWGRPKGGIDDAQG